MTTSFKNFPTPHSHPQSFDSASTPQAFAKREAELGTGTITVTDHGSMAACRQVYDLAKAKGLTPILGLEAYFRDDGCTTLKGLGIEDPSSYLKYFHLTMHALDERAFNKLTYKLSHARMEHHGSQSKPLFDWNDLEEIGAENITFTSGCLVGMVQRHILNHTNLEAATAYYERLRSLVRPGNFYVEVFPHKCDKNWVAGIFLDLADGQRLRFWEKKKLKFEKAGDIEAAQLAKVFGTKKWDPEDQLIAVMNNRKWEDREPQRLLKAEHIEEFMANECSFWAPDGDVQKGCNRVVMGLAQKYGDKILISDDSHYAHEEEKIVQDIRLQQMGNWRFYGSYHRQSSEDAFRYFRGEMGISEARFEGWIENNIEWASKFQGFTFHSEPSLPTKFYPSETLPHTIALIRKHGRMDWSNQTYVERLQAEINLLHYNGTIDLLPYFFIDEDVTSHYESIGMLTGPGRGSAAGLLLTYLLGITHVDPLKFSLSMDRFLTVDRIKSGKLPDIDQDLPTRDPLVGYDTKDGHVDGWLKDRFGDHFAQISVDTTLKLKSSVKDVARVVHGRVPEITEQLAKKFQLPPQGVSDLDFVFGYEDSGSWKPGSIESDEALKEYVRLFPDEWAIVQKCLGLARQKSRHPCAYVIANKPIAEFIPLQDISGFLCTQYTAPSVEAAGGLKMDFLVINSLNDIQDCIRLIQQRSGLEMPKEMVLNGRRVPGIRLVPQRAVGEGNDTGLWHLHDIWDLPEDLDVFRDVAEGKTETVFQFNTPGAVQWLKHFDHWKDQEEGRKAIDSIEAMSAFTALDRPGPLDSFVEGDGMKHNMLVEYARRARGEKPIGTLPVFEELLPETYGVMVYQEQLQRMYQNLTGCSGPEAEEFRANVAKKKMKLVLKAYEPWMERVGAKLGEENAKGIWDFFVSWGQYGFNKSHSVCYSVIGYACAYLKHHFPLEWWCAVLRNADKNEVNETFWRHCGGLIDLPDVTASHERFEIVDGRIRAPVSLLHGVGEGAHNQLMRYRPYRDIDDFCEKIEAHCVDNAKPVLDENGERVYVEKGPKKNKQRVAKMKRAHNALTRSVCYKLIVAGCLDSLFPKATEIVVDDLGHTEQVPVDVSDRLMMFEAALARAQKKKPKAVDPEFTSINAFQRYQMRKQTLPAYSEQLLPMIVDINTPGVSTQMLEDGREIAVLRRGEDLLPFVTPRKIDELNLLQPYPEGMRIGVAAPAYVVSQRLFQYSGGTKKACEIELDIDGVRMKFVRWPNREGKLPALYSTKLQGAIAIAALSRFREDRPFGLDDLIVVVPPLGADEEAETSATEE